MQVFKMSNAFGQRRCFAWLVFAAGLVVSSSLHADGLGYLATQQQPDGSFGGTTTSLATPVQTTAEVLRAYQALGQQAQAPYTGALNYLNANTESNTEYLARQIIVNAQAGNNVGALVNALLANQNSDGGFGDQTEYGSTAQDTAFALEALATTRYSLSPQVAAALTYLVNTQTALGGWVGGDNNVSVYATAQVLRALWLSRYQSAAIPAVLTKAQSYLLSQRDSNGSWGDHFNTALALLALIPSVADQTVLANSLATLQTAEAANGSWLNDPYTTALAVRALSAASQPQPDPSLGAVSGRATDSATGALLSGVTITALGTTPRAASSGADGYYLITNVAPGAVSLTASLAGYVTANASGTVVSGQALAFNPRLVKDPQPVSITVRGIVVRKDTGAPLSGAMVSVINTTFMALTGTDGRFEISGVPAGSIQLAVQLSGFLSASYVVSAPSGGLMDLGSIALISGASGATTGSVQGSTVDALTGLPLRNVAVSLAGADSRTALTDVNGQFAMTNVNAGSVNINATLDGYQPASGSGTVSAGGTLVFTVRLVKLANPALTTVTGRAVDASTQVPLSGVTVQIANTAFSVVTSSDGLFQVGNTRPAQSRSR